MSEKFKLKYEVAAILRDNIVKGLTSFGVQIANSPGEPGWVVMESDQPAFRNVNNAVLFFLEHMDRIGWQSNHLEYNKDTDKFDSLDYFIEQQIWKIRVLGPSSTKPVTDEDIPIQPDDIVGMLLGWFNRLGCEEFRKYHMANLFVQAKDVRTYKDKSDASQWVIEFPLKLQVIKQFETEVDTAEPVFAGMIPIKGESTRKIMEVDENGNVVARTASAKGAPKSFVKRIFLRLGNLLIGISQETPKRAENPPQGENTTGEQNGD